MPNPAKITALRIMEGNRGHRPLPRGEPQPRVGVPKIPESVMASRAAARKWRAVLRVMGAVPGWVTQDMVSMLERYALAYAQMIDCERFIAKEGMTYEAITIHKEGKDNEFMTTSWKRRPETVILKECRTELLRLEAAMGIGPGYRTKVDLTAGQDGSHDDLDR